MERWSPTNQDRCPYERERIAERVEDQVISRRHTGFIENFHEHLCTIYLCEGGFPNHHITHHGSRSRKITCNSGEIEWGQSKYKSFQRPVFNAIPDAFAVSGLFSINLTHERNIVSQKVDHLTGAVNFSLESIFRLSQHCSCVHFITIRTRK